MQSEHDDSEVNEREITGEQEEDGGDNNDNNTNYSSSSSASSSTTLHRHNTDDGVDSYDDKDNDDNDDDQEDVNATSASASTSNGNYDDSVIRSRSSSQTTTLYNNSSSRSSSRSMMSMMSSTSSYNASSSNRSRSSSCNKGSKTEEGSSSSSSSSQSSHLRKEHQDQWGNTRTVGHDLHKGGSSRTIGGSGTTVKKFQARYKRLVAQAYGGTCVSSSSSSIIKNGVSPRSHHPIRATTAPTAAATTAAIPPIPAGGGRGGGRMMRAAGRGGEEEGRSGSGRKGKKFSAAEEHDLDAIAMMRTKRSDPTDYLPRPPSSSYLFCYPHRHTHGRSDPIPILQQHQLHHQQPQQRQRQPLRLQQGEGDDDEGGGQQTAQLEEEEDDDVETPPPATITTINTTQFAKPLPPPPSGPRSFFPQHLLNIRKVTQPHVVIKPQQQQQHQWNVDDHEEDVDDDDDDDDDDGPNLFASPISIFQQKRRKQRAKEGGKAEEEIEEVEREVKKEPPRFPSSTSSMYMYSSSSYSSVSSSFSFLSLPPVCTNPMGELKRTMNASKMRWSKSSSGIASSKDGGGGGAGASSLLPAGAVFGGGSGSGSRTGIGTDNSSGDNYDNKQQFLQDQLHQQHQHAFLLAHCPYLGVGDRVGHQDLLFSTAGVRGSSKLSRLKRKAHGERKWEWIQTRLQSLTSRLYEKREKKWNAPDEHHPSKVVHGVVDAEPAESITPHQNNSVVVENDEDVIVKPTELTLLYLNILQRSEDYRRREILRQYEEQTGFSVLTASSSTASFSTITSSTTPKSGEEETVERQPNYYYSSSRPPLPPPPPRTAPSLNSSGGIINRNMRPNNNKRTTLNNKNKNKNSNNNNSNNKEDALVSTDQQANEFFSASLMAMHASSLAAPNFPINHEQISNRPQTTTTGRSTSRGGTGAAGAGAGVPCRPGTTSSTQSSSSSTRTSSRPQTQQERKHMQQRQQQQRMLLKRLFYDATSKKRSNKKNRTSKLQDRQTYKTKTKSQQKTADESAESSSDSFLSSDDDDDDVTDGDRRRRRSRRRKRREEEEADEAEGEEQDVYDTGRLVGGGEFDQEQQQQPIYTDMNLPAYIRSLRGDIYSERTKKNEMKKLRDERNRKLRLRLYQSWRDYNDQVKELLRRHRKLTEAEEGDRQYIGFDLEPRRRERLRKEYQMSAALVKLREDQKPTGPCLLSSLYHSAVYGPTIPVPVPTPTNNTTATDTSNTNDKHLLSVNTNNKQNIKSGGTGSISGSGSGSSSTFANKSGGGTGGMYVYYLDEHSAQEGILVEMRWRGESELKIFCAVYDETGECIGVTASGPIPASLKPYGAAFRQRQEVKYLFNGTGATAAGANTGSGLAGVDGSASRVRSSSSSSMALKMGDGGGKDHPADQSQQKLRNLIGMMWGGGGKGGDNKRRRRRRRRGGGLDDDDDDIIDSEDGEGRGEKGTGAAEMMNFEKSIQEATNTAALQNFGGKREYFLVKLSLCSRRADRIVFFATQNNGQETISGGVRCGWQTLYRWQQHGHGHQQQQQHGGGGGGGPGGGDDDDPARKAAGGGGGLGGRGGQELCSVQVNDVYYRCVHHQEKEKENINIRQRQVEKNVAGARPAEVHGEDEGEEGDDMMIPFIATTTTNGDYGNADENDGHVDDDADVNHNNKQPLTSHHSPLIDIIVPAAAAPAVVTGRATCGVTAVAATTATATNSSNSNHHPHPMSAVTFGELKRRAADKWCYTDTSEVFVGVPNPSHLIRIISHEKVWDRFYANLKSARYRMITSCILFWEAGVRRCVRITQVDRHREIVSVFRLRLKQLARKHARSSGGGGGGGDSFRYTPKPPPPSSGQDANKEKETEQPPKETQSV